MAHDLVIRNGRVIDGTGSPARVADVAIRAGRIVAVGEVAEPGQREIDAAGSLVTPGFVDVHTHYDGQVSWDALLEPSIYHGVTTVVMGNCGVGFAPADPTRHEWLISLMEGVEDIPGTALAEGLTWDWESFPEYLDAIEKRPHSIDFAAQVPHGALRAYVMGERGANHEERPTGAEVSEMARLTREAIEAGAVGFTTSRTLNHKTADGEPTPSLTSSPEELWGIAAGLADAGTGVLEVVSDFVDLEAEFPVLREMAKRSGRPMSISVLQLNDRPEEWRRVLELIAEANADGLRIFAQVAPRPVGVIMSLESTFHPYYANTAFNALAGESVASRVEKLRDPAIRKEIAEIGLSMPPKRLFPFVDPPNYEPAEDDSVTAVAAREGRDPSDLVLDLLMADEGRGQVFMPALNYAYGNSDHCREMMLHPNALPGLGDGGAHVSFISDASFPTYCLTHWGRDRDRGELIPIETLIQKQTRDTAGLVGFNDRGVIAPGMKADLNVIDLERLKIRRPELQYDLPAGGKRLVQRAEGYRFTIVSGEVVMEDGQATGANPGKLVRGPQAAPTSAAIA